MGIKISQLPSVSASPLGLGLKDIQSNAVIPLVQSLSTQQVDLSAVGGAVFVESLSALTLRKYNFGGATKNNIGVGSIDLQYKGNAAFQVPSGQYSAILGGQNNSSSYNNTFILGSNLSAAQADFTYVNNISSQGIITGTLSAATYVATITSTAGTDYVLTLNDASRTLIDTASTTTTYSVPSNTATAFAIGTQIIIIQGNKSASNYTVLSAGNGVTINSYSSSLSLAGNYAAGTLIKTATDTWYLIGNLA